MVLTYTQFYTPYMNVKFKKKWEYFSTFTCTFPVAHKIISVGGNTVGGRSGEVHLFLMGPLLQAISLWDRNSFV